MHSTRVDNSSETSEVQGGTSHQNQPSGVNAGWGAGALTEWARAKVTNLVTYATSMLPTLPKVEMPAFFPGTLPKVEMPALRQVTLRGGVRLMVATNALMGTYKLPAETTVKGDELRSIGWRNAVNTMSLMGPNQDVGFLDQAKMQDEKMARHFSQISAVEMPEGFQGSICGTRFDIAKVHTADGPKLTMWEFNSTGWVSIHMMPDEGVAILQSNCRHAGRWLAKTYGPKAMAVVMASGREPVAPEKNSVFMHEKVWVTQEIVAGMREVLEPQGMKAEVIGFEPKKIDKLLASPEWTDDLTAKGLVAYFEEMCTHAGLEPNEDGVYFLHGEQIGAFYNDRGVSGIQESKGTEVNTQRTLVMNPFVRLGTDKAMCYKAYNEFMAIHGAKFPNFVQRISYTISSSKELVEAAGTKVDRDDERVTRAEEKLVADIKRFHRDNPGKTATIKPFNTGHGDGIEYIKPGATDHQIEIQVRKSLDKVWSSYNKDALKSGFPFTIVEKFEVMGIEAEEGSRRDYADGWKTEFGLAVMGDHRDPEAPMIRSMPYLTKLENPKVSTGVANVSSQMAATGRPSSDFSFPICNKEGLEDVGLAQEVADEMAIFGSMLMQHVALNATAYGVH